MNNDVSKIPPHRPLSDVPSDSEVVTKQAGSLKNFPRPQPIQPADRLSSSQHIFIENSAEDMSETEWRLETIGRSVVDVAEGFEYSPPSLQEEVARWGNEEICLLYYEYQVAKKITGGVWLASEMMDVGVNVGKKGIAPGLMLAEEYVPDFGPIGIKIEREIAAVSLVYKIPSTLGKVGVLIYKKIFIERAQELLQKNPEGMSDAQKAEFQDFINEERKEIASTAKDLLMTTGKDIPGNMVTLIRLCAFNLPLLRLGLTWVAAVLDPVFCSYELYKATKKVIKIEKDISQFNAENFRRAGDVQASDANFVINTPGADRLTADEIMEGALKHRIHQEASVVRNARCDALLEKRDDYEDDFNELVHNIKEPVSFDEVANLLREGGIVFSEDLFSAEDFIDRTGVQSFHSLMEEALREENMEDIRRYLINKGMDVAENVSVEEFKQVFSDSAVLDCIDGSLASTNFSLVRRFFEERGLALDPEIKERDQLMEYLADDQNWDNMLARYIDVNSKLEMADSARNALKTLTMKKQKMSLKGSLANLTKAKFMLAAAAVCSISTVVLSLLAVTGVVSVPLIAFFIAPIGIMGLGAFAMLVGVIKFYRDHPNLFMEYVKGSFIKLAVYNIPKSIYELRRDMAVIQRLKASMKARKLGLEQEKLSGDDRKKAKVEDKQQRLQEKIDRLDGKFDEINEKVVHWERKMQPITEGIAVAKWKDFLQERPQLTKKAGRKVLDEEVPSLGEMRKEEADAEVRETVEALRDALWQMEPPFGEDIAKIAKERMGIDLNMFRGSDLNAAVYRFAP